MSSRNILLTISYDGTEFCGWQRQDNAEGGEAGRTVQGEIEKALEKIHKEKTALYGSGRTDSGVHAVGQAANFYSPIDSIAAREVPEDFSVRKSATSRVYRYFISTELNGNVTADNLRYCWRIKNYTPDLQRLNKYCGCLHGELDCSSFAASGDDSISNNRYIDGARFFLQKDRWGKELLVFEIEANAFLWKMVRTLTGTLVNLDKENAPDNAMKKILEAKDRKAAGVTAPPNGLFLYEIKFDGIRRHV